MAHTDFVHLRVHTAYSLLEGAIPIGALADLCRADEMPALAITDTANMFGVLEFSEVCSQAGIQPIIGTILNVSRETDAGAANGSRATPDRIVLLAQNEEGYANLIKLSSRSFLENEAHIAPQVSRADLAAHAKGLIALTGGPEGPVNRLLRDGQGPAAEAALTALREIYAARLYVELQRHGVADEARIEPALIDLAYRHDVPLVATNNVYFADADMYEAHDALICVAEGAVLDQANRRRLTPEHRFKSAGEMRALFEDVPEAVGNTLVVAQRCAYRPPARDPILPTFTTVAGRDETAELRAKAESGLEERLEIRVFSADMDAAARAAAARPYHKQLEHELDVITGMNFPGYFLIVADFIEFARSANIPVGPGRGSGAGSVVAWALGITDLDPLYFGLVFERFLNPDRISMPDFDIDFCQEKRDQVIRYVQDKYGHDRVAQIITFGTLQARAVLRDVGRVLQMPYGQVDRLCKMVPYNPANPVKLAKAIEGEPRFQQERDNDEKVAKLLEIAKKLEGLYRHASTHAAGVVIGDRPLDELIPLYRDPRSDVPVTQFSMKYAELAGLIKFDFLGLKTLTVLDRARALLAARGIDIDYGTLPLDDAGTYALMAKGDTIGIFQFESPGMRDLLREAKPDCIEDIIALVALFRPGPMENIPKYVACKRGREAPEHLHELIEPVVKDTYGVIVYQEQVMQIAQVFAGYSMGEADLLRRAMGKKIKSEMEAQRDRFVSGAVAKGVPEGRAVHVFNLVDKFAGYGFNKAHSAGYALIAYQTAWLKTNHPVEFLAASMTLDLGNTDKLRIFKRELDRFAIPLWPPDINTSGVEFGVEEDAEGRRGVRYALAAIKNVGRQAMEAVMAEREANGRFESLADFAGRVDPRLLNRRQLENLACAGAFDSLHDSRAKVFGGIEVLLGVAGAAARERESQQESLFGDGAATAPHLNLPEVEPWEPKEHRKRERDAIGFYLSAHPLDAYRSHLGRLGVTLAGDVSSGRFNGGGNGINLAGTVEDVNERTSARGDRYARLAMSDPSGDYEVMVFANQLNKFRDLLTIDNLLLLAVDAGDEGDRMRFTANKIEPLEPRLMNSGLTLDITLASADPLKELQQLLGGAGKGRNRVNLILALPDGDTVVDIAVDGGFALSLGLWEEIANLPGVVGVREHP